MKSNAFPSEPPSVVAVDLHELLTVEEVADLLKVSKSWVYEHTRARDVHRAECLPHIRIGKYLRFDAHAVRLFLAHKARH